MGRYTIIAEIDEYLVKLLAEDLAPELLPDKNAVGLCAPEEHGDLTVGIYLYDIQENETLRVSGMVNHSFQEQAFPPTYLSLYYMITVWASSDIRFRAIEEHRLLGRILQLLKDHNLWEAERFGNEGTPNIRVEYLDLTPEDKAKVWNHPSVPYRTSLFFRVAPVSLDSARTRAVNRVTDVEMQVRELEEERMVPANGDQERMKRQGGDHG